MKVRVCVGDVDLTVSDMPAYSPDVLEDVLTRTVTAAARLHVTDVLAIEQLAASEAPPVGSEHTPSTDD